MGEKPFSAVATVPDNDIWQTAIHRERKLYTHENDKREAFERDFTRILHSLGYRRLKHKTQVFFNTHNDHICTRMEHVQHVASVSHTIAHTLGLNTELTNAIATGHDLGHAPFGHQGETVLKNLVRQFTDEPFFHEKNSLIFVDDIELLEDTQCHLCNLNLTYAVRDGLISHCGEIDENHLKPRTQRIDLRSQFQYSGQYQPFTWEGCVVKVSDKIAYLGRDIEDAARLNFLDEDSHTILTKIGEVYHVPSLHMVNTSVLISTLISDLCQHSNPLDGLQFSQNILHLLNEIKAYNSTYIYNNEKFHYYKQYVKLVLTTLYTELSHWYAAENTFDAIHRQERWCEELAKGFGNWLALYCEPDIVTQSYSFQEVQKADNRKIYGNLTNPVQYKRAIVDYIAGMTDPYAIKMFHSLTSF